MATKSLLVIDSKTVRITIDEMLDGSSHTLTISNVTDINGEVIALGQNPKIFVAQGQGPEVASLDYIDPSTIDVIFNEPMEPTLLEVAGNYTVTGTPIRTVSVADALPDGITARLTLDSAIPYGTYDYTVEVKNVTDIAGNLLDAAHNDASVNFYVGPWQAHATLETGLIAHYTLDVDCSDSYTNALHGTQVGPTTPASPTEVIDGALDFTAIAPDISSYTLPFSSLFDNLSAVTLSCWIRVPTLMGSDKIFFGRIGHITSTLLGVGAYAPCMDTLIYVGVPQAKNFLTEKIPAIENTWAHCVFAYDGAVGRHWVNATPRTEAFVGTIQVLEPLQPWRIGIGQGVMADQGNTNLFNPLKGYADEFTIWGRVLTQAEVTYLYNSGDGRRFG